MSTMQVNDVTLYYDQLGNGEPVLLLHGLGSRGEDWAAQTPEFSKQYRVIAPDIRGHGRSGKPPGPYSVPLLASDISRLMDGLGIDSAHLVGLSMGGMIAFQMAVDQPRRVRSLTIVNSAPEVVPHSFREWLMIRQRLLLARLFDPARTAKFLGPRLFPKPEQEPIRQAFVERWATNDKDAYLASIRALAGWSVLGRIGTVECPVLVISGDRDYTPVEAKRAYASRLPNSRLVVIEDSGHATPIDQAERFNECVLDFLRQAESEWHKMKAMELVE